MLQVQDVCMRIWSSLVGEKCSEKYRFMKNKKNDVQNFPDELVHLLK